MSRKGSIFIFYQMYTFLHLLEIEIISQCILSMKKIIKIDRYPHFLLSL